MKKVRVQGCILLKNKVLIARHLIDESTWNKYITDKQFYPSLKEIRNKLIELKYIYKNSKLPYV